MSLSGVMKVKEFIKMRKLRAEVLEFRESVESVSKASKASGMPPDTIIKTLIVLADDRPYAVLLLGNYRLSLKKLRKFLGVKTVRLAKPDEVGEIVGLKPGEVSPLIDSIAKLSVIVDEKVLKKDMVLVGGGSIHHLVKISVKELISVLKPIIADVSEGS
mgnify:FL=1